MRPTVLRALPPGAVDRRPKKKLNSRQRHRYNNLKSNSPHGDTMMTPKPTNTFRAHAQNIHGCQLTDSKGGSFYVTCDHTKELDIDYAGFTEINADTRKASVQDKLHTAARLTSSHYRLQSSSSTFKAQRDFKPGGTLSLLRNNSVSRLHNKGSDPLGRWSHVTLNCHGKTKVTFITAYQPCCGKPKLDSATVVSQQCSQLLQEQRLCPEKTFCA